MKEAKDMNPEGEEQARRIAYLIAGYIRQTLSEKEHDELDEWITASDDNQVLFEELIQPEAIKKGLAEYGMPDTEAALKRIKSRMAFTKPATKRKLLQQRILRYGVAASIFIMAGLIIFYVINKKGDKPAIAMENNQDMEAGGNKAMLTLTNGKTIDLTNARNGLIDSSSGADVLKTSEGQISYEAGKETTGKGSHVLSTPAGGQYAVTLPDGTRVWLNAQSELKYPVVFGAKERVVELSGEGYFEVAPHPRPLSQGEGGSKIPFIVKLKNGVNVEVKGTHFNINAYEDEGEIRTTLLEGKVVVNGERSMVSEEKASMSKELSPGQQAKVPLRLPADRDDGQAAMSGEWSVVSGVDTTEVIAWKNGKFQFKDATIEAIMKQVARWYDAEIIYEGKIDYHFNATTIYRSEPLSKLLEVLEATERVRFEIKGRRIIVRNYVE